MSKAEWFGVAIATVSVVALNIAFAASLATFFILIGVAAHPALVTGLVLAFTIGFFCENYFYQHFLGKYTKELKTNLAAFKEFDNLVGLPLIIINAAANGAAIYFPRCVFWRPSSMLT